MRRTVCRLLTVHVDIEGVGRTVTGVIDTAFKVKLMSLLVSAANGVDMESFIHLRKGITPRRLHADLGGLKDDELGRGGFTGRTANMYRRNDPTAYRSVGPLRPVDVLSSELKPSDAQAADPIGRGAGE